MGVNDDDRKEILKKYNELGEEGVKNLKAIDKQQTRGKKPLLTLDKIEKLKQELAAKPADGRS